jgi:hypothetical protein
MQEVALDGRLRAMVHLKLAVDQSQIFLWGTCEPSALALPIQDF